MKKSTIGITGTGSLIGQAIIKSIKSSSFKENTKLIGMDYFKKTIGSYCVDSNYILPDILKDDISENMWVEQLLSIIKEEKIDLLFVGVDFELPILARFKKAIEEQTECTILVNPLHVIEIADDKYLTYQFLKEHGFSYPKSYLPDDVGNAFDNGEMTFPCILKPRKGYRARDVYLIQNMQVLKEKILIVKDPVIQEYLENDSSEFTCGTLSFDEEIEHSIILRRDLQEGNTSTAYYDSNFPPEITEYVESVAKKLKTFGACNFQLRLDVDGKPKIFEINARHSGTTYIRSLFGYNEVEVILKHFIEGEPSVMHLKEGVVKRFYDEFFVANE